jgi:hypothetical protein
MANKKRRGLPAESRAYRLAHKKTDLGQVGDRDAAREFQFRESTDLGSRVKLCLHARTARIKIPSERGQNPALAPLDRIPVFGNPMIVDYHE